MLRRAIDDEDLGAFNSCDGLGCEFVIEQREEGGNNGIGLAAADPDQVLERQAAGPVTQDSAKIAKWIAGMAGGVKRKTATIVGQDAGRRGGRPLGAAGRGAGPLDRSAASADSPKVATETLELAHHGFLRHGDRG